MFGYHRAVRRELLKCPTRRRADLSDKDATDCILFLSREHHCERSKLVSDDICFQKRQEESAIGPNGMESYSGILATSRGAQKIIHGTIISKSNEKYISG